MYIKSIQLKNIKLFENVTIDFTPEDSQYAGFHVLVGGNASGKSTILKSIAIAASPYVDSYKLTGGNPLAKSWMRLHAKEGILRAMPTNSNGASNYHFDSSSVSHIDSDPEAFNEHFVIGYGPFRRLSGASSDASRMSSEGGKPAGFLTLFREDAALADAEEWLRKYQFKSLEGDKEAKELVQQTIKFFNDGLLPAGLQIDKVNSEHVYLIDHAGTRLPMRDLSDGCRSVYALILDILFRMAEKYGAKDLIKEVDGKLVVNQPGVVLIDELESHLHPSWQQTLCTWLKERFPKVQFIVTTHSPLVVQAADNGTIHVLPMPDEDRGVRKLEGIEKRKILMGKAEKILLGEAFGLDHTRGNWALARLEEYRKLEAKHEAGAKLTPGDKKRLKELEEDVDIAFSDKLPPLES